ncbi:MAG: alkaline phosphatase PhoX [Pseudonocardiaceae bacterium]
MLRLPYQVARGRWGIIRPIPDDLRRSDADAYAAGYHRFGWIVEIDPSDPGFIPRKRTAMGRFKHEAATVRVISDGTVASTRA